MATFTVTVDHTKVADDLTDFPMLVDLADMPSGFWATVSSGGGDIRCFDASNNPLPREVVSCDVVSETGELWVRCDLSESVDTVVTVEVDGTSSEPAPDSAYGSEAVWSSGYAAVWHLGDTVNATGGAGLTDISGNVAYGDTLIGRGMDVTAASLQGLRDAGFEADLNALAPSGWTVRLWAKDAGTTGSHKLLWNYGSYGEGYGVLCDGTSWIALDGTGAAPVSAPVAGGWEMITVTWDATAGRLDLYHNASFVGGLVQAWVDVETGTSPLGQGYNGTALTLGRQGKAHNQTGRYFTGWLDDAVVSSVARSPEWIATEYANQSSPSTFYATAGGDVGQLLQFDWSARSDLEVGFGQSLRFDWGSASRWTMPVRAPEHLEFDWSARSKLKVDAKQSHTLDFDWSGRARLETAVSPLVPFAIDWQARSTLDVGLALPFIPEPDMEQGIDVAPVVLGIAVDGPIIRNDDPSLPSWDALPEQTVTVAGEVWSEGTATIASPLSVSFTEQFRDVGSASVTCMRDDVDVTADNLIRISVGGVHAATMVAEDIADDEVAPGEEADQTVTITGRLIGSVLERIVVVPERGLGTDPMPMDRVWDWTAIKFDDSKWSPPAMRVPRDVWIDTYDGAYRPPADVLWGVGGTVWFAPPGACYFRWSISKPPTTSPLRWQLWSDNAATWYLDGQLIAETQGPTRDPQMFEATIDPGYHRLSCVCLNGVGGLHPNEATEGSPQTFTVEPGMTLRDVAQAVYGDPNQWGAVYMANAGTIENDAVADGRWDPDRLWEMATAGQVLSLPGTDRGEGPDDPRANPAGVSWALTDDGDLYPDEDDEDAVEARIFADSGQDNCAVLSYPARVPGMTPGRALLDVLTEWTLRGGGGFATPTFTEEADSAGRQWPAPPDIGTKIGTSLLAFLGELSETYIDWRLSPDGQQLDVFVIDTMGKAASGGPGEVIAKNTRTSTAQKATWLLTSSQIGWQQSGGGTGKDRYESTLGLGALRDYGTVMAVGGAQAARAGEPSEETTIEVSPSSLTDMPYVAYRPGDWLNGEQVWGISMSTDEEGRAKWVVSLGSAIDVEARRQQRALDKMSRGTIGGSSRVAQPIVMPTTGAMSVPRRSKCCTKEENTG